MSIRKDIGNALNYTITDDMTWRQVFDKLGREGRVQRRQMLDILVILLEREEKRENEK